MSHYILLWTLVSEHIVLLLRTLLPYVMVVPGCQPYSS